MSYGQDATIILRDNLKVRTEMNSISDDQLKTKAGTFGLSEIYSVRIHSDESKNQDTTLVDQLLNAGVIVYLGDVKQMKRPASEKPPAAREQKQLPATANTQTSAKTANDGEAKASFGIGIGQDYGGIGARFTYLANPHLGIYGSGGYALAGFGYNVGAMLRMQPAKKVVPTLNLMYGYNAVIVVQGASQFNEVYYGPTFGFGFISKNRNDPANYWHFELLFPFRSSEFDDDLNALKKNPAVQGIQDPLPLTFSIGYHFSF